MKADAFWPRGLAIGLLIVLALFSASTLGLSVKEMLLVQVSRQYGNRVRPSSESIAALIFSLITVIFALLVFVAVHSQRANGAAVGWSGAVINLGWTGIVGFDIFVFSAGYANDEFHLCQKLEPQLGSTLDRKTKLDCQTYTLYFTRFILACVIMLILFTVIIVAFRARINPRTKKQQSLANSSQSQGTWPTPGVMFVPVQGQMGAQQGPVYMQQHVPGAPPGQQYMLVPVQQNLPPAQELSSQQSHIAPQASELGAREPVVAVVGQH